MHQGRLKTRIKFILLCMLALSSLISCRTLTDSCLNCSYQTKLTSEAGLRIARKPGIPDYSWLFKPGSEIPAYNENNGMAYRLDLRNADLSTYNLMDKTVELLHASFDTKTRWPEELPAAYNPDTILELGKDPGFGIRHLHRAGISGQGVSIAIIDQTLLVDHVEYASNLKLYEEIHVAENQASMHGAAVASIAVGQSCGVAPAADLYFLAVTQGHFLAGGGFDYDLSFTAQAIERICEINKTLDHGKIRVISISLGLNPKMRGYNSVMKAIRAAQKLGIYTVYVGSNPFIGIYRDPLGDPNNSNAYGPGLFWRDTGSMADNISGKKILIPMDSRTTAAPTGIADYVFYANGGMSWTVPYVAAVYALACQVYPGITPQKFWQALFTTGHTGITEYKGRSFEFGVLMDPVRLLHDCAKKNDR
jgi:hypothetical protein